VTGHDQPSPLPGAVDGSPAPTSAWRRSAPATNQPPRVRCPSQKGCPGFVYVTGAGVARYRGECESSHVNLLGFAW